MKINKYFLGLVVVLMGALASCNTDVEGEYYNPKTENISFEVPATSILVPVTQSSASVPIRVTRSNVAGAYTAHYTVSANADGIFSDDGNGTVNFSDGQGYVTINVNANNLDKEVPYKYTMTLSDADAQTIDTLANKQYKEVVITVQREGDWILIGEGTFSDNFYFEGTGMPKIYYNEKNPSQFRVEKPFEALAWNEWGDDYDSYDECMSDNFDGNQTHLTFTVLKPGDKLGDVTITQENLVYFSECNTGYLNTSYGQDVKLYHPSEFSRYATEDTWIYNRVIEWQENGLPGRVQLAPYYYMDGVGGWNNTQADGIVIIDFPGYDPKDYALEMEYTGVFTSPDNVVSAIANLKLGADAKTVKAVVVSADDDAGAVADALVAGDLEGTDITESGYASVPIPEGLTGKLQMVVVIIDNGEVKVVDSLFFEYYGGGENPWNSLGVGYWTDDMIYPLFTEAGKPVTYQVEIEENKEEPGVYRVIKPYAPIAQAFQVSGGNENIIVNAEDPDGVYILDQPIGLDLGYGPISLETDAGYYVAKYGFDAVKAQLPDIFGHLKDGVIEFPVQEKESSSGAMISYQIWVNMGGSSYFGGRNGEFKIVLPNAPGSVKKKAQSMAKASEFEARLNKYAKKVDAKDMAKSYYKLLKKQVRSRDALK